MDPIEEQNRKMMQVLGFNDDMTRCHGYLVTDLHAIFNKYCNKEDWRSHFDAIVTSRAEKDKLMEAIRFMLADDPTVTRISANKWKISTRGYQAW